MPSGTELSVGYFQITTGKFAGQQQVYVALMDTSSYTCTSTPPGPAGPPDGSQLLYGDPSPAPRVLINKCRNGKLLPRDVDHAPGTRGPAPVIPDATST